MNKVLKCIGIVLGAIAALLLICFIGLNILLYNLFGPTYTKEDMMENYDEKYEYINELHAYINKTVPLGMTVDIEFDDNKTLDIFHVTSNSIHESNWNIEINSSKTDSLLHELGWTRETLKTLKQKLDDANCISIENGEPVRIGYQRSGMGKYYYNAFATTLTDSLINRYNDDCSYLFYKNNIILEYGSGAIGSDCIKTINPT